MMDCKKVRDKVDALFFDENIEIEPKYKSHIDQCEDCQQYYFASEKAAQEMEMIKSQEPILDNPDALSSSIMDSISKINQERQLSSIGLFTRIIAAAVIALALTLGIEQYTVLTKMQRLEIQLGKTTQLTSTDQYLIYKSAIIDLETLKVNEDQSFSLKKISTMFKLKRAKQSNFTFYDISRYMNEDAALKSSLVKTNN